MDSCHVSRPGPHAVAVHPMTSDNKRDGHCQVSLRVPGSGAVPRKLFMSTYETEAFQ
jgi:hypothetical protein